MNKLLNVRTWKLPRGLEKSGRRETQAEPLILTLVSHARPDSVRSSIPSGKTQQVYQFMRWSSAVVDHKVRDYLLNCPYCVCDK